MQIDSLMYVIRPKGWMGLYALLGFVVIALSWSVIDTVPMTVSGDGILLSPGGILEVVSPNQGVLKDYHVQPGQMVRQGQVVATIDQPELELQLAEALRERQVLLDLRDKTQNFQSRQIADRMRLNAGRSHDLQQTLAGYREQLKWLNDRGKGMQTLYDQNIITKSRMLDQMVDQNKVEQAIAKTEGDMRQLNMEEEFLRIQSEKELLEIDNKIRAAAIKIEGLQQDLDRETKVTSPYSGTVTELYVNVGEVASRGSPLFSLVPPDVDVKDDQDKLLAVVYISPSDGKKVRRGMQSQVIPSIVKRTEYGGMIGQVRTVADIPSSAEGMLHTLKNKNLIGSLAAGASPYEVRIGLQPDAGNMTGFRWTSRPPNLSISPGTLCSVDIMVLYVHPITLLIPALKPWLPDRVSLE